MESLKGAWVIMRQRFDKDSNAIKTADSVMESIKNPVEAAVLIDISASLKDLYDTGFDGLGKRDRPEDDDFGD